MAKKTQADLLRRAERAITAEESVVWDVCAETGQMFGNVRHMRWFVYAVANQIIQDTAAYAHLPQFEI